jgi:hypothetical protein
VNVVKVEKLLSITGTAMLEQGFDSEEYLVYVANLLLNFGKAGLNDMQKFPEVNIKDAFNIELTLNQHPDDPHLAALLQGHAILKWSQSVQE